MWLRRVPMVLAAAVTLLAAACGGGGPSSGGEQEPAGEPQRGGTVVFSWNSEAQSIDAARCGQSLNWGPCQAIYGTLLNYDSKTAEFSPGMAESFTSDDGITWTLTLRDGVRFTDGTPFNAEAVVFNWDRAKDPASLSPGASVAAARTYEAVDPRTVRVILPEPNWQLPWAMYGELAFIGSPTAIREKGAGFGNTPVGAGPFTFVSWARGTRMELTRNESYWDQPRPYADRFVFAPIGPDDQRLNALRSGEITVMTTLTDEYAERAVKEGFVDHPLEHIGGVGARFSHRNGPLADPDVRMAIAKSIDAQQINDAFYDGASRPSTWAPESTRYFDPAARYPEQDLPGAQRLIDGHLARTGESEVVVTYRLVAGIPLQDQVAQMLQAQLQRVRGLRLEIVPLDGAAFLTDVTTGNFHLSLSGIGGVNPDLLYQTFHTGASQNAGGYSDLETDAALERARTTKDPAEQLEAYKTAMQRIAANVGHLSWRYQIGHTLVPETVHGVDPSFYYHIRADTVWMEQS